MLVSFVFFLFVCYRSYETNVEVNEKFKRMR